MAKSFVKVFLICLVLFTLILIPVVKLVSNIQIFDNSDGVSGGIEDEIDVLVDPNSHLQTRSGLICWRWV